jgi:DNA-binding MarR family transcriptional regulator
MPPRTPKNQLPSELPPTVMEAFRERFSGRELQALGAIFLLRTTARQVDNIVTEWLAGSAGSAARFQVLSLLWASGSTGLPHKKIVAALGVTRATVSGLMAALERDGLVKSVADRDDRRSVIASLTARGQTTMDNALEVNAARLRAAFAPLSTDELARFTSLLQRIRQSFEASGGEHGAGTAPDSTRPPLRRGLRSRRSRSPRAG